MRKIFIYTTILFLLNCILSIQCSSQKNNSSKSDYATTISLINNLCEKNLSEFKHLYEFEIKKDINLLRKKYGDSTKISETRKNVIGWIIKETSDSIYIFEITGEEFGILKANVNRYEKIEIDESLTKTLRGYRQFYSYFPLGRSINAMPFTLVSKWLHNRGNKNVAEKILNSSFPTINTNTFGHYYFNKLLFAYSHERNYDKAIKYGTILARKEFYEFEYQKVAVDIAHQLEQQKEDFKTFVQPDSLEWASLKKTLSRPEQIEYLVERIHILNCIQQSQPGRIYYSDPQLSIAFRSKQADTSSYEELKKFEVINPYNELFKMNLDYEDLKPCFPLLLDSTYIPIYSFHRDFFPNRIVHKYNWVIVDLINDVFPHTINKERFDILSIEEKKKTIEQIKIRCEKLDKEKKQRKQFEQDKIKLEEEQSKAFKKNLLIAFGSLFTFIIVFYFGRRKLRN